MKTFYSLLANTVTAGVTNNFIWFALTFWAFLETKEVVATSTISGFFLVATAICGIWFGSFVDHTRKKLAMLASSVISLGLYGAGLALYLLAPEEAFKTTNSIWLWGLVFLLMSGVVAGNIRTIALPTTVTILVPEEDREKANGLAGGMMGVIFSITSFASGIVLASWGMLGVLLLSIGFTILSIAHLTTISIPESEVVHLSEEPKRVDLKGTVNVIQATPGLMGLLFFNTFNNFLGGVFMALMDPYGLSLVSVKVWGTLWGFISLGFIIGGVYIARNGLGGNPVRRMFLTNIVLWNIGILFSVQPWIVLLAVGMFLYVCLVPFVEAAEQTIIQKVVPAERQGRVFGLAQSVESSASPLTAFLIGPIAQYVFIPFMTKGAGAEAIGSWFGTGTGRGIALVFIMAGIIGLIVTVLAMRTSSYRLLKNQFAAS